MLKEKIGSAKVKQRKKAAPKESEKQVPEPQISEIPVREQDKPKQIPEPVPVEIPEIKVDEKLTRPIKSKVLGMRDLPTKKQIVLPEPKHEPEPAKSEPVKIADSDPHQKKTVSKAKKPVAESDSESSGSESDSEIILKIAGKKNGRKTQNNEELIAQLTEMRQIMELQNIKMDKIKKKTKKVKDYLYQSEGVSKPEKTEKQQVIKQSAPAPQRQGMDPMLIRNILKF